MARKKNAPLEPGQTFKIGDDAKFSLSPTDWIVGTVEAFKNGTYSLRARSRTNADGEQPCPPNDTYGVPASQLEPA